MAHLHDREVLKLAQACLVAAEVEATLLEDKALELTLVCGTRCLDYLWWRMWVDPWLHNVCVTKS